MAFLTTIGPDRADGVLAELYDQDRATYGFVANHTQALSLHPDAVAAFRALARAIKGRMDPRRFELVTVAAARALHSSYCMLSHTTALRQLGGTDDRQLTAIAVDHRTADLSDVEVAVMDHAEALVRDASATTAADVDGLRRHGLTDEEILDVALTVALRCFYSTVLDAVGAQADAAYADLDPDLRVALVVGRPIAGAATPTG